MCLAIPAEVLELQADTDSATVSLGGVRRSVSLALVDDVAMGDFVLVHVGYALNKISPDEAARTLALMREAGLTDEFDADAASTEQPISS